MNIQIYRNSVLHAYTNLQIKKFTNTQIQFNTGLYLYSLPRAIPPPIGVFIQFNYIRTNKHKFKYKYKLINKYKYWCRIEFVKFAEGKSHLPSVFSPHLQSSQRSWKREIWCQHFMAIFWEVSFKFHWCILDFAEKWGWQMQIQWWVLPGQKAKDAKGHHTKSNNTEPNQPKQIIFTWRRTQ